VLSDLTPGFEQQSKDAVLASNDTAGGITKRIGRGEEADLVILTAASLDALASAGHVIPASIVPLARVGIGMVVKEGAPVPDIGTAEAFKAAVLAARSIAYIDPASGGSSGIYLAGLFQRLDIADAVRRKAVLVPGGLAASRVDNGEATMALQQISELRLVRGVRYVGPLPPEIQNYTEYAAAVPVSTRHPAAGRALLAWLLGPEGQRALAVRGLEKP
jgi:molybdate transport system substrate-binding protein